MPRTKAVRRRTTATKKPSVVQLEQVLVEFDLHVQIKRARIDDAYESKIKQLNMYYEYLLESHKPILNKTVGEVRKEFERRNQAPKSLLPIVTITASDSDSLASSNKDDGYVTDVHSVVPAPVKSTRRLSRSLSRNNTKMKQHGTGMEKRSRSSSTSSAMGPPRSCRPRYRIPNNRVAGTPQYPLITPKVTPNTPLTVLRRPRNGEMVVSLSGSPLLVNSISGVDDKANCNIPLSNGTILSILPNKLMESGNLDLPFEQMRPETRQELKMLQINLNAYLKKKASKYKF